MTKTLKRTQPIALSTPHIRALAVGIVTGRDHAPIADAHPYLERYGADTLRCSMVFMGPHQNDTWLSPAHIAGVQRFLSRLAEAVRDLPTCNHGQGRALTEGDRQLLRQTHQTIYDVTNMMETDRRFHLAVAAIMHLLNETIRLRHRLQQQTVRMAVESAALLLVPFAPQSAADACRQITGQDACQMSWPTADPAFLDLDEREVIVQVDGKLRDRLRVSRDISREELTRLARRSSHAQEHIRGHRIRREVVVPGKLVNFVTV